MDALAALGSLVVTDGNNAAALAASQVQAPAQQSEPPSIAQERQAVDAVFTRMPPSSSESLPQTLLVATAGACALKGVVLDEKKEEEEELRDPKEVLADQQPRPE
jgi:hypothetical protein